MASLKQDYWQRMSDLGGRRKSGQWYKCESVCCEETVNCSVVFYIDFLIFSKITCFLSSKYITIMCLVDIVLIIYSIHLYFFTNLLLKHTIKRFKCKKRLRGPNFASLKVLNQSIYLSSFYYKENSVKTVQKSAFSLIQTSRGEEA